MGSEGKERERVAREGMARGRETEGSPRVLIKRGFFIKAVSGNDGFRSRSLISKGGWVIIRAVGISAGSSGFPPAT